MSKIKRVLEDGEFKGRYVFICPGCGDHHVIPTEHSLSSGTKWGFNNNIDNPTFTPSILVKAGHYSGSHKCEESCWCTYNKEQIEKGEEPSSFLCYICHSFVTDGKIQFLNDCTHKLSGQTVELTEIN